MAAEFLDALRPMYDCLTDGVCIADSDGRLLYANSAAGTLLGPAAEAVPKAAICGLLCAGFKGHCAADAAACPLRVPRGTQDAMTFKGEYAPTGRELRVRCMRVRLPRLERYFLIIEDVSAQAEAGRQKEEWRQMLAHDFRSPLTVALGTLCALKGMGTGHALAADDLTLIERGVRNCRQLDALISTYLDTTCLEDGAMPVHAGSVDLETLIHDVVDDLTSAARTGGQKLTCTSIRTPIVHADPKLLRRALVNIIGNAIKFTPPGGLITVDAASRGRDVLIRVADNGPGITAQDLPRIFDRYYQGASNGQCHGLGLGLTFCRGAMHAMGGEVDAESEEGRGTVFTLSLPSVDGGDGQTRKPDDEGSDSILQVDSTSRQLLYGPGRRA